MSNVCCLDNNSINSTRNIFETLYDLLNQILSEFTCSLTCGKTHRCSLFLHSISLKRIFACSKLKKYVWYQVQNNCVNVVYHISYFMPKDILFERSKIKMPVYKIIQKIIFLFLNITFFSHITYVLRFMFPRHARIHNSVPGWGGGWCCEARHEICAIIYITSCTVKIFSGVSYIRREKVYCQWNIWIKKWINSNITIKRTVTIFFSFCNSTHQGHLVINNYRSGLPYIFRLELFSHKLLSNKEILHKYIVA